MTCPMCGGKTHVIDSRPDIDNIYRVRRCKGCDYRFPTVEIDEDLYLKMKEGQNHHANYKPSCITITRTVGHRY